MSKLTDDHLSRDRQLYPTDRVRRGQATAQGNADYSHSVRTERPTTVSRTDRPLLALRLLNPISAVLPLATWRPHLLVHSRELLARALGMGHMRLSGTMPSGHVGTMMPRRMFLIEHSTATFEGVDLGAPAHLKENPRMGKGPLPSRGVLAIGGAAWQIADRAEYERTRAETAPKA